jgi:hypothetical protein
VYGQLSDAENQRKEPEMEATTRNGKEKKVEAGKTEKRTFWKAFINFLTMGGFLVVLIAIAAIIILISKLTQ